MSEYHSMCEHWIEENAKYEERIEQMKEMLEVQSRSGNWDYSEYMFGMYNGMEFMLALAEDREPVYKQKPKWWLKDKEYKSEAIKDK